MEAGAIGTGMDVAQVVLYAFWLFFAGLIFYLRREDRREGYPLESETTGERMDPGIIWVPEPKTFRLPDGGTRTAPRDERDTREIRAKPVAGWTGAPLEPTGDPMRDGVGPAAYALRPDKPEAMLEGEPRMAPLRVASDFFVEPNDPDPRGMSVVAADGVVAGTVYDVWVDRAEPMIRHLEVELTGVTVTPAPAPAPVKPETPQGEGAAKAPAKPATPVAKRVLLPITFVRYDIGNNQVNVASILASQFAHVPTLKNPDQVTMLEEDRISAYYASGHMYAEPGRSEPWL